MDKAIDVFYLIKKFLDINWEFFAIESSIAYLKLFEMIQVWPGTTGSLPFPCQVSLFRSTFYNEFQKVLFGKPESNKKGKTMILVHV